MLFTRGISASGRAKFVEELAAIPRPSKMQSSLALLRLKAAFNAFVTALRICLVAFANQVVDAERPGIEEGAVPKRVETAVSSFEKSNALWRQLLVSLVTSIVTIAVLVLFTLSAGVFGIDVVDESLLLKTTSEPPVAPAGSD